MKKIYQIILFITTCSTNLWSQSMPFEVKNNSPFPDSEIYVGIIGSNANGLCVYVDGKTGKQEIGSPDKNTIMGKVELVANFCTKLTDIPINPTTKQRTITLKGIGSARVFFSVKKPLYTRFNPDSKGYRGPEVSTNPLIDNAGVLFEFVELNYGLINSNNDSQIFFNTTRVDAYNYAIGIELFGKGGFYKRAGELIGHQQIQQKFLENVPPIFQKCLNRATGRILYPTSVEAFKPGGENENYFKSYINAIWETYKKKDLLFDVKDGGVWRGRVAANDVWKFTKQVKSANGTYVAATPLVYGIIMKRPNVDEALNGKGVLGSINGNGPNDLDVQKHISAAINRHLIDVDSENYLGLQDFTDVSKFYLKQPYNAYARFWHLPGISFNRKSYGFPYDDTADQSSTLATVNPTKISVSFGGFAQKTAPPPPTSVNLALKKPNIYASSIEVGSAYGAVKANDGIDDGASRWSSDFTGTQEWIYVNLGNSYKLNQVVLKWEAAYAVNYDIQVSNDLNWSAAKTVKSVVNSTGGIENIPITATGQFVRILCNKKALPAFGYSLFELEVYGNPSPTARTSSESEEPQYGEDNLNVYPNPSNDFLKVNFPIQEGSSELTINDMTGKVVMTQNLESGKEEHTVDVRTLKGGTYILLIRTEGKHLSRKIIKFD